MRTLRQIQQIKTLKKYKEIYDKLQKGTGMNILWKEYKFANENTLRVLYYQRILPAKLNNWEI